MRASKTWLITGCSSGFGRAFAEAVLGQGDQVVMTVREIATVGDLLKAYPQSARALTLDLSNPDQIEPVVRLAEAAFDGLDVLVNNAGTFVMGAVEEMSPQEYLPMIQVNFLAPLEVARAVIPAFRRRGSGVIVMISSVAGMTVSPGMGLYAASKFALEAASEAMSLELAPHGVRVIIIEPGAFRTRIISDFKYAENRIAGYEATAGQTLQRFRGLAGCAPGDPQRAALALIDLVNNGTRGLRVPFGTEALARMRAKLAAVGRDFDNHEQIACDVDFAADVKKK